MPSLTLRNIADDAGSNRQQVRSTVRSGIVSDPCLRLRHPHWGWGEVVRPQAKTTVTYLACRRLKPFASEGFEIFFSNSKTSL